MRKQRGTDASGKFDLIGNTPGGGLALDPSPLADRMKAAASAIESEPWAWTLGFYGQAEGSHTAPPRKAR